ncbi:MAG: efflux RND transporter periplasmic adaptor subunit [Fibrobacter sp.]|nr:efflux RND transporter periplasmic adaptor subunit [Fibrobacter sp.]
MNKKILIGVITVFSLLFTACSGGEAKEQKKSGGGSTASRVVRVEGYVAQQRVLDNRYQVSAALLPMDDVELKAETSGRLVQLPVKDGASVSKGALIAKIDDSELKALLAQANAQLELEKQKEARTRTLHEKDGATTAELESAVASLHAQEAQVAQIQAQMRKTEIRAPFSGRLGFLSVSEGEWMTSGASVSTLSSVQELKVEFSLPQRYASMVAAGDSLKVIDDERGLTTAGKIQFLEPTLTSSSRSRKIRAMIRNPKEEWMAGSFVKAELSLRGSKERGMAIPTEAITLDDKGPYVFVYKEGKAVQTRVQTGLRTPISIVVINGLAENDTVIISGLMSMRNGTSVEIRDLRNQMNYEVQE